MPLVRSVPYVTAALVAVAAVFAPTLSAPSAAAAATHSCADVTTSAPAVFDAKQLKASQGIKCSVARKVATPVAGGSRPGAEGDTGVAVVIGKTAWDCFWSGALPETGITSVRCKPTPADSDYTKFGKGRITFKIVPAS